MASEHATMADEGGEKENARRCHAADLGQPPSVTESATSGAGNAKQHKLKQRFAVIKKLGKGTYGKVQLAVNRRTGQEVAIKTIKKTKIESVQDLERVRREIQIMSSIEHPHIVHIYEVFENRDKIVLIMQYAPGGELYEYVSQSRALDEQEARRLFRQIATAIFYCHQNKICHRDLKLENILLDERNNAKLADFGLSNVFDKSRQLKTFCGSPLYASPEIVRGSPYEGPEVDCWSLGVLLYTLVYGAMPFDGTNFKRLVRQISEANYVEPRERSRASPLIGRLLCADPSRRATIADICSDPWVNAQPLPDANLSPTGGSRPISPLAASANSPTVQNAHPSLLKVAEDMAKLTPVRLDILLKLVPHSAPAQAQSRPPGYAIEEQVKVENLTPSADEAAPTSTAIRDRLGSDMMQVDGGRMSPVASFVVRDLARVEGVASEADIDRVPEAGGEQNDFSMLTSTESEHEQVKPINEADGEVGRFETLESSSANDVETEMETTSKMADEEVGAATANECNGADTKMTQVLSEAQPRANQTDGTAPQTEVGAEKPKRVKKRIVVVKRKRKVVKKTEDEGLQPLQTDEPSSVAALGPARPANVGEPVGRVRIPETFKPTAGASRPEQAPARQPTARRPSALIADVSHKLLQQVGHPPPGCSTIELDQRQLACVRVSDTKSEFERRASLAVVQVAPATALARDSPGRSLTPNASSAAASPSQEESGGQVLVADGAKTAPPICSKRETVSRFELCSSVVELVARRERLEVEFPLPRPEPPRTPTNQAQPSAFEPGRRLSVDSDWCAARPETGERSDSVETLKADETPGVGAGRFKTSLQVELRHPLVTDTRELEWANSRTGPMPITRSYKKVTFTQDGSCVTETGRIYSTRADDGTLRRIERKSKVTHYPAAAATTGSGQGARDEVVYADDRSQTFVAERKRARPFERLVMPAAGALDEQETGTEVSASQSNAVAHFRERAGSASSCSSDSTDIFDDIFDNWTGAISMFGDGQKRHSPFACAAPGALFPSRRRARAASPLTRFGSPGSVWQGADGGTLASFHSRAPLSYEPQQENQTLRQRCDSAEPGFARAFNFGPRPWHQSANWRPLDCRPDAPLADLAEPRPASASNLLNSRARFGSANLLTSSQSAKSSARDDWTDLNVLPAEQHSEKRSLLRQVQIEHERIRRMLAQRRAQLWRGSTPALNEVGQLADLETGWTQPLDSDWTARFVDAAQEPPSLSQFEMSTRIARSSPLSATPLRRNTASSQQLPPRQPARCSTSKTSTITSQLAEVQLNEPHEHQGQRRIKSASFIGLKRDSSTSPLRQRPLPPSGVAGGACNASAHAIRQQFVKPTASSVDLPTDSNSQSANRRISPTWSPQTGPHAAASSTTDVQAQDTEANSRIQNWLLQSAENLSISSGSKSSASDAPPSNRPPGPPKARSLTHSSGQPAPIVVGQSQQTTTRTISVSRQAPLATGRPPSAGSSRDAPAVRRIQCPWPAFGSERPVSMLARSSSRHSLGELGVPMRVERREVHETFETIVSGPEDCAAVDQATRRSTDIENRNVFVFPNSDAPTFHQEQQQCDHATQIQSTSTTSRQEVFATEQSGPRCGGRPSEKSVVLDDLNDFDSLLESGIEFDLHSSSSLLDQLRSRGYRSIMNQRLVAGVHPQQRVAGVSAATTLANDQLSDAVSSSNNSMATMSSSGAGLGTCERDGFEDRIFPTGLQSHTNDNLAVESRNSRPAISVRALRTSRPDTNEAQSGEEQEAQLKRSNFDSATAAIASVGQLDQATQQASPQLPRAFSGPPAAKLAAENQSGQSGGGSASLQPRSPNFSENSAELDEDVREAKASIREHLKRIRETEKFLKDLQEQEKLFQQQRQEAVLFNSLLLGSRMNGTRGASRLDFSPSNAIDADSANSVAARVAPHSAPIPANLVPAVKNPLRLANQLDSVSFLHALPSSSIGGSTTRSPARQHSEPVSCFSSDLFRPIDNLRMQSNEFCCQADPLTLAQVSASYAPHRPMAHHQSWLRSKSQLGDQFFANGATESQSRRVRPNSVDIDCSSSPDQHIPSRHRRSISQMRHQTPSSAAPAHTLGGWNSLNRLANGGQTSSMVSEYKSSYCQSANLQRASQQDGTARCRRATTSPLSYFQVERNVGLFGAEMETRPTDCLDEDDDVSLNAYRAASYVPKVVPEGGPSRRSRALSSRWRIDKQQGCGSASETSKAVGELGQTSGASPPSDGMVTTRGRPQQPPKADLRADGAREVDEEDTDGRRSRSQARRSSCRWTQCANDQTSGSRLSELEQRLQANKRRREELLSDINEQIGCPASI